MRVFESRLRKIETAQRVGRGTRLEQMSDDQLWGELYVACAQLERIEGPGWQDHMKAELFSNAADRDSAGYPWKLDERETFFAELLAGYETQKAARRAL